MKLTGIEVVLWNEGDEGFGDLTRFLGEDSSFERESYDGVALWRTPESVVASYEDEYLRVEARVEGAASHWVPHGEGPDK
jgi:hypothetical protein